jgi:hypothetical protein
MKNLDNLITSFKTMLQILTKVFGIKSCNDTNQELHGKLPQLYAKGHLSVFNFSNPINLNIPNTKTEFELLIQLASLITQNIGVEFPELLTNISFTEKITDKMNVPHKIINTKLEFEIISEKIKKLGLTKTQQTHL